MSYESLKEISEEGMTETAENTPEGSKAEGDTYEILLTILNSVEALDDSSSKLEELCSLVEARFDRLDLAFKETQKVQLGPQPHLGKHYAVAAVVGFVAGALGFFGSWYVLIRWL